jgi:hypothetical protein
MNDASSVEEWRDHLRRLTEFLEKTQEIHQSSGIALDDPITGFTFQLIPVSLKSGCEHHDLGVGEEFARLLDALMSCASVTPSCAAYLSDMTKTWYNLRYPSQVILETLTDGKNGGCGPFVQLDFAGYEKQWLTNRVRAISVPIPEVMSAISAWCSEWFQRYGSDADLESIKLWADSVARAV